jgi:hypothetical protein
MNKLRIVFFLALAAALATGMLLFATLAARDYMGWLTALPANQAKLVTPALITVTVLFLALAGHVRSRRGSDENSET